MFSFFKRKQFHPDFPIIPLYATEAEVRSLLAQYATVTEEEPESDKTIAKKLLVAHKDEVRVTAGIWDGRVRFANYLTKAFNDSDDLKGRKLRWFVDYFGGIEEFDKPQNTGHMIFWRNPKRKIMIVFGLHFGPVRIVDQDPTHWSESGL